MEVRRIGVQEWAELRDLRLRALQDAPDAFGSTHAEESARTDAQWMEWASALGDGPSFGAVAVDEDRWVGMAVGSPHRDHPGEAGLFAMWVAPDARRAGLGRALVEQVVGWAHSEGFPVLRLRVALTNDGALHLYERCGFFDDGVRIPLRADSGVTAASMTLDLSA